MIILMILRIYLAILLFLFYIEKMSKNKGKDKKNQASSLIEKQLEAQKRDIIDYEFTIKKLEHRLAEKVFENDQLKKQLQQVHMVDKEKIKILNERAEDDQKRLTSQISKITELEINVTRFESLIKSLNEELMSEKESRQKEVSAMKIKMEGERNNLIKKIDQLKGFDREKTEQQILNLKDLIEYQKSEKIRQLADKQRQKVQATDKLRDEMLKKIRQMRTNLLSLKKEQLSTTTRLTILQNHQLTSQLQYQSKQTEKLIFKQEQMHEKIKQLTQELNIHKQVQQQLAKRAHFSKGVIKKLNQRVAELQKQLQTSKDLKGIDSSKNINNTGMKSKIFIEGPDDGAGKQLLLEVEKQLSMTEKKYTEAQSKLQALQKERDSLTNQLKRQQVSCNQLAKILLAYSQQIMKKKNMEIDKNQTQIIDPVLKIDLELIRSKNVEEWTQQQTGLIIKILLNLIKPYITKKNILIPSIRRLLVLQDSKLSKPDKLPKLIQEYDENTVKGLRDLPTNIASKIVGSNLRQWGNTVTLSNNVILKKKYNISQSHR